MPVSVRRAIVRAVEDQGMSYEQAAELLGIGRATVSRVLRRNRKTGRVDPSPRGGGRRSPIHGKVARLLQSIVTNMPDATVAELTAALMKRGKVETSRSAVLRAIHRLGFTLKKSPSPRWSATRPSTDGSGARSARSSRR